MNCEKFIPKKIVPDSKKTAPSINAELKTLIKLKSSGWKNEILVQQYKSTRNNVKKTSRDSVRKFEMELATDKKNPKKLFSYINIKKKVKQAISAIKNPHGNLIFDKLKVANILNGQFKLVFVVDNPNKALPNFNKRSTQILNDIIIKYDEVKKRLENLNINKSQGVDKLHLFILQKCSSTLAYPLTIIYKESLETSKVLDAFL